MVASEMFLIIVSAMVAGQCLFVLMLAANNYFDRRVRYPVVTLIFVLTLISVTDPLAAFMPAKDFTIGFLAFIHYFLIGPAFWAYVVRLTDADNMRPSHISWVHALPFILGALLFCAHLFVPPEQFPTLSDVVEVKPGPLMFFINSAVALLFFALPFLLFWYAFQSFKRLKAHRALIREEFADIEGRQLLWLEWLGITFIGYWLYIAVGGAIVNMSIFAADSAPPLAIMDAVLAAVHFAMISVIGICGLRQKPAFAEEPGAPPSTAKYEKSALTPDMAKEIAMRIENLMATKRLYLDPILTLRTLARSVGAPPNHVSQTLNETLGTSFFDYVNGWRVKHCLPAIQSGDASIMTVAYDAGFNSRSAFYKAFKRVVGRNPIEYRRQVGSVKASVLRT